ncbi:MAG: hypothetical protein SFX73_33325 [Kofleriaceae bacterium]|nr:hypothetical protein [Kofleriaceae bacterium]
MAACPKLGWLGMVVALAGCDLDDDDDDRPIVPISVAPTIDTNVVTGRVCRVTNLTDLALCSSLDVDNLTIEFAGSTATTLADGSFAITAPTTSDSIAVAGATTTPTLSPFPGSAFNPFVPVVDADVFARVFTSNNILQAPNTGTVLAFVQRNGVPVSGVFARTVPVSTVSAPLFDGVTSEVFTIGGTGPRGVILAPGLVPGGTQVILTDSTGSFELVLDPVRVLENGVTIVNAELP